MKEINPQFEKILNDNLSGGAELLEKLIIYFERRLSDNRFNSDEIETARKRFSEFAVIADFLNKFSAKIEKETAGELVLFLKLHRSEMNREISFIAEKVSDRIHSVKHIVTLSNSSTLLRIFDILYSKKPDLIITVSESRPQFEGRITAQRLSAIGYKVNLCTEAQLPEYVETAGACLIGADKVLSDNSVINKTGSRLLAILASYYGIPFYAAAAESKFSEDFLYEIKDYPAREIFSETNKLIQIKNRYFEWIDKTLVTEILY